jgi:hypothetical protein
VLQLSVNAKILNVEPSAHEGLVNILIEAEVSLRHYVPVLAGPAFEVVRELAPQVGPSVTVESLLRQLVTVQTDLIEVDNVKVKSPCIQTPLHPHQNDFHERADKMERGRQLPSLTSKWRRFPLHQHNNLNLYVHMSDGRVLREGEDPLEDLSPVIT